MKTAYRPFFLFSLFVIVLSNHLLAQTIQIQGEQTGVLQADTVILAGDVLVPAGGNLSFIPGTKVIATGFFGFEVEGSITAIANADNPIVFTVADTSGFYNSGNGRGGWDGFHYLNTNSDGDSSVFSYCNFEFGKASGDSLEKMGGVFNIHNFDKLRISGCEFFRNTAFFWGGAIFGEQSNISILNCSFSYNFCGNPEPPYGYGGALCFRYSAANVAGCSFAANSSTGIGGAVSFECSDVLLMNSIFQDNYSALGGALGYLRSTPTRPVIGNLFTGNSSEFFGGAISCNRANPCFINNTIANNSSVSYGGGLYCNDSAKPVLVNTIIYDNTAPSGQQVYIWDVNSGPSFYFCNIQGNYAAFGGTGGTGFNSPYIANIDSLPAFSGIQPHPYSLLPGSPCINTGQPDTSGLMLPHYDLAGNHRVAGSSIDIGAYEFQQGTASADQLTANEFLCWPNPFSNELNISCPGFSKVKTDIRITDLQGKLIFSTVVQNELVIHIKLNNIAGKTIAPGIYLLTISDRVSKSVKKLVKAE